MQNLIIRHSLMIQVSHLQAKHLKDQAEVVIMLCPIQQEKMYFDFSSQH